MARAVALPSRRAGVQRLAGMLAVAVVAAAAASAGAAARAAVPRLWQLPQAFTDEHGQRLTLDRLAGAPTVVAMEYTACRFVCSTAWRKLAEIQAEADRRQRPLRFVILSIDPAHDTPALWREYRAARGLQGRGNWQFLTGDRAATDAAARLLGVRWWLYDGAVMHDFRILRLDAQGHIVKALMAYDLSPGEFLSD